MPSAMVENVVAACDGLVNCVPKKWRNVQSVVLKLETRLQRQGVPYKEISVQLNIELESSVKELADMLQERLESFIQQRLQHIIAHNSHKSFRISGMGTRQKSRQLLKAPTP